MKCQIDELKGFAERIIKVASTPFSLSSSLSELAVSASIGIVFVEQSVTVSMDELIHKADEAMYQAKKQGKNRFVIEPLRDSV